jgi:hypothetical protein
LKTLELKPVSIHPQAMGAKQLGDLVAVAEFAPNSLLE